MQLIPVDPGTALDARLMDRFFDNYVMTPVQKIVGDCLRPAERRDAHGVTEARALLDRAYAWLEDTLQGREWAAGDTFSVADCAAAPSLFYADWVHEIPAAFDCSRGRQSRKRWTKRGPTGTSFRPARRTGTELTRPSAVACSGRCGSAIPRG